MSDKIKFPCCVETEDLVEEDITALSGKFTELGATPYEDNTTSSLECWRYYGVEESGRICFWDKPSEYLDEGGEVTIYTLDQVLAATGVDDCTSEPLPAGWIEWKGGDQPVKDNVRVDVRFRGGDTDQQVACGYRWGNANKENGFSPSADIIAYRVIDAQEANTARLASSEYQPTEGVVDELKPLLNVIKHVSYTVEIKGVKFEFTDEEYMELVSELRNEM